VFGKFIGLTLGCGALLLAGCLDEKVSDGPMGTFLPPDVTRPEGADAGTEPLTNEITPLPASQFVFQRGNEIRAYDLASGADTLLFDGKDVASYTNDLSPDRKWLAVTSSKDKAFQAALPVWVVSVDGRQWKLIYRSTAMNEFNGTLSLTYSIFNPSWSADGTNVFYILGIYILNTVPFGSRQTYTPHYMAASGDGQGATSTCEGTGLVRAKPTDPAVVILFQSRKCDGIETGLNEFSLKPFKSTRILVPSAEVGSPFAADWLADGAAVIYNGKEGLSRLDLATGTKTAFFKPTDPKVSIFEVAVGPANEIIVTLRTPTADPDKPAYDIYRVFPDTGMTTALTTDGKSRGPSW
jgi:hypothetical protein